MTAAAPQPAKDADILVQVPNLAEPSETLAVMRDEIRKWDAYWAERHDSAADGGRSPAALEAMAARRMLRGLLAPLVDQLAKESSPHLGLFLNLMVPFDSRGGLRDFMLHFFQFADDGPENLEYEQRGLFERDVYVLYDLYRVQKTLDVVQTLKAARQNPERIFPSIYDEERIGWILNSIEQVLSLLFEQCLPAQHRKDILPRLSPSFLKSRALLERRETDLLYTLPHVLEKYDYRRFFFLIYFKQGLKTKMRDKETEFHYDFLQFQVLKHEFLVHWLTGPLSNDPRKYGIYKKYIVRGKSLLEWISEDPSQEQNLLKGMSSYVLNDMASQVNEVLPEELRVGTVPESQDFGFYHQLKQNLERAVDMVRAPIESLRKIAEEEDSAEEVPPLPPPPEPSPPPVPQASAVEPHWDVTLLKKNHVPKPFLMESVAGYDAKLNSFRARLAREWREFSGYVSDLLEKTPEISTIRRRTPKHEWVMPYRLRWIDEAGNRDYLLILGVEVKARPRGMGYQAKEAYNFKPYFVFGAEKEDEDFGTEVGERAAAGGTFKEFDGQHPAVSKKVMELIEVLKANAG
ncbi:MAG: hypothetical protein O7G32_03140 [SAR324 cluster bacterium]|nr:hypothetical protein [SAR324 cluster bacterium]